ncbi:MAG: hypothetical protein V4685_08990 [Bacteroidota bacterium]
MKRKLHRLIVFLLLCQLNAVAQKEGFNYEAAIKPVDSSGFYNIVLTPELNAHLKTDYSDLRIVNDTGKWVPHLVRNLGPGFLDDIIVYDLKTVKKESSSKRTELIVTGKDSITSNLVLYIGNTVAERFCAVSGSNDLSSWFIINDSVLINPVGDAKKTETTFDISFPPCNYKFLRLQINNQDREPFNMIKVGTRGITSAAAKFGRYPMIENPACVIYQKDSSKLTVVKVEQSAAYHFEVLSIKISGVKYFKREAYLYIPNSRNEVLNNPKHSKGTFTLSNNSTLQFHFPKSNPQTFYIFIHNDDNLPLRIEEVKTFNSYRVATAYFEKGNHYKLLLDNPSASIPNYDLDMKDISEEAITPSVTVGKIISLKKPTIISQPRDSSNKLIWFIITIAAIVLGFFTYRLITDMNKSKT